MSRRLEARNEDDLAEADKLDLARTLLAYAKRKELRHEKEYVLSAIKQSHREEVKHGQVTTVSVPTAEEIIGLYARNAPALNAGASDDQASDDDK